MVSDRHGPGRGSCRRLAVNGRASAGHRIGLAADAPLPGCDHDTGRRRKLAAEPQAPGGRHRPHRHHSIIGTFALVPGLGRLAKHRASSLAGVTPRVELVVAGSGDTGSLDTGSLRAHGLAIGPGPGSCRRHGGMERWWGGGADDRAAGPKGPKAPRPTPETSDVAFTRSSRRPSCSRSGSTQAACRPTRLFTRHRAARISTSTEATPWYAGSAVQGPPARQANGGAFRSIAERQPEGTPPESSHQTVMATGGNGLGRDHAGVLASGIVIHCCLRTSGPQGKWVSGSQTQGACPASGPTSKAAPRPAS